MQRYLVTTSDERSWKTGRPLLFLGEWCKLYDRKPVWSALDAVVAEPYGLDGESKRRDVAYVQELADQLLIELGAALNAFHGVKHGVRYWNMLLGHWLQRYVAVTFNRYAVLEQALRRHDISGTTVFAADGYCLAAPESDTFVRSTHDEIWNHVLYANILRFMGCPGLEIHPDTLKGVGGFATTPAPPPPLLKRGLRHAVLDAASKILPQFVRETDAFISGSTLPVQAESLLQLRLGQVPQLWPSPPLTRASLDRQRRREFGLDASGHDGFEAFVRAQLTDVIPVCYLEGYAQLVRDAAALPWPSRPKFIFTSVRFGADELFKAWAADKVERLGTPYYVGQHGNNYGTHLYAGNPHWPERVTADKFFSWGWSEEGSNVVPAIIFRQVGRKPEQYDPAGGLLLIEKCNPPLTWPWDRYAEFSKFQEDQFRFVEALSDRTRAALTVRMHYERSSYKWFEEMRWRDRSPATRLESGHTRLRNMIAQSRIVVHSYDSTGVLETLIANVPTLCFVQPGVDPLLECARPYYDILRQAGILVESPEQAAQTVEGNWDNIVAWWSSAAVQKARIAFCDRYARMHKRPIAFMKELLSGAN
jgi:putative transferase (TIGR04331 family)